MTRRATRVHHIIKPEELRAMEKEILQVARGFGLDPFTTIFEMIDWEEMNEVVSYSGFPSRYPHWRFGMEFETMRKSYAYGLHKIYELVINNDPCYAYLLQSNSQIEQKIVIAHVFGHSDFFRNNLWYAPTNRKMLDQMANHGARIKKYMDRQGVDVVEDFTDTVLSIEHMIDVHSMYTPHALPRPRFEEEEEPGAEVRRIPSAKGYMDRFINPPEFLEEQKRRIEEEKARKRKFPERPERDVLLFLIEHAPLENWQKDILCMIREESYYFAPQAMTKVMNEGWASYWHSKILTDKCLADEEVVDFADINAGVLGGGAAMNPYKLGVELYRDIEERWNKGKFGRDYDECDDLRRKEAWDTKLGKGREKLFEVRRVHNDITFLDNFLTEEFCERHKLFLYRHNPQRGVYEIASRDFATIKQTMLFKMTNMGHPIIEVEDGNYKNRSELFLRHRHEGIDLEVEEAKDTMRSLQKLWKRPVNLQTIVEGQGRILTYDGTDHKEAAVPS
jgi:stage V sporulation protein R